MALGKTKQRLELLEEQIKKYKELDQHIQGYRTAHSRADQRLDRTGPALIEILGDVVTDHVGGRSKATTYTADYDVVIYNDPTSPIVTLHATVHDIDARTWPLSTRNYSDFSPEILAEMEEWTIGAKTGTPVDRLRHAKRAEAVNQA